MVTDTPPSTLRACMIFSKWRRKTSRMVLCVVHALYVGIRSLTLTGKPFTPTGFTRDSCHTIMFVPSTEKIGVMMEDGEEEEYDDNYVPPEYGDAANGEADDVPDEDQEE